MPKETGIVMSGSHPKLILDGVKTMTRRVIKPQPLIEVAHEPDEVVRYAKCPYGGVGDRLWVREPWGASGYGRLLPIDRDVMQNRLVYGEDAGWQCKRPSIFMPRWASRILLEITELRAERLQEITDKDARAEGVEFINKLGYAAWRNYIGGENEPLDSPIASFQTLWDSLNAKRGYPWAKNNWVWPIRFRMIKQ